MITPKENISAIISKLVMATAEDWDDDQTIGPNSLLIRDFGFASIEGTSKYELFINSRQSQKNAFRHRDS